MGNDDASIALALGETDGGDDSDGEEFAVLPENEAALRVFLALSEDWVVDGLTGQVRGIDKAAMRSVMEMVSVKDSAGMFADIKVMERAALDVIRGAQ